MMTGSRLVVLLSLALLPATTRAPERFSSPEAAARALGAGARATGSERLAAVLGPGSEEILASGDPVADASARRRFATAASERTRIERTSDTMAILHVGRDDWPLPIPIVRDADGWRFD